MPALTGRFVVCRRPGGFVLAQPLPKDEDQAWRLVENLAYLAPSDGTWMVEEWADAA